MILKRPTDIGQKLDSREAVRYMFFNWRLIGMYPTKTFTQWYYVYAAVVNTIFAIGLPLTMNINLLYVENLEQLVQNLYLNITVTICTIKQAAIYYYLDQMQKGNTYLEKLDARCNPNKIDRRHILDAVFISHLFYIYTPFYFFIGIGFASIALRNHQLQYSAWFPSFFEDPGTNFLCAYVYQCLAHFFLVFQNGTNDMYPPCYLMVMISHLRALCARIERMGKDEELSVDENLEELVNCIQDHKDVLEFFNCIRPVISTTIFLQFLITAVVLCLSAINFIAFDNDAMQLLFTAAYLVAIISESFPCCWLANVLMDESRYLTNAIYKCSWYGQNQKFRQTLIIFMQRSQRAIQIMAGNMVPVGLQTFVAVVKFAFSMYTLMSEMKI